MKYYTSDLHFCHKKMLEYEARPCKTVEEMNELLITNWNNKVKKGDLVYILGDFAFCDGQEATELLSKLNGQKVLLKGNHDSFFSDKKFDMKKAGVVKMCVYETVSDEDSTGRKYQLVLFHFPIAVWDRKHHGSIHLFGHVHSNTTTHHPLDIPLDNAYNVGVDVNDYEPVTLDELIKKNGYKELEGENNDN